MASRKPKLISPSNPYQPRPSPSANVAVDRIDYVMATHKGDAVVIGRRLGSTIAVKIPRKEIARLVAYLSVPLKYRRR